jgi:hypothetical protein
MAVLSVPMLYIKMSLPYSKIFDLLIFLSSLPSSFLLVTGRLSKYSWRLQELSNIHYFIYTFYTIAMGFSFHNTIAVLGLLRKVNSYTPKLNIEELKDKWKQNTTFLKLFQKNIIIEY